RVAAEEMLLKDALETVRRDRAVPSALRIDHQPRTACTNAEAAGFRAHGLESGFAYALLHVFPYALAFGRRAAIRADAEEQVAFRIGDARLDESGLNGFVHGGRE